MPLSLNPKSLIDIRLESARQLTDELGRPPTRIELSGRWGISVLRVNYVLRDIHWRGIEIPITKSVRACHPIKYEDRKIELQEIAKELGRLPTAKELADCWGISEQRARVVRSRLIERSS